ncbi:MAG: prohibitin family protein [bacterium]
MEKFILFLVVVSLIIYYIQKISLLKKSDKFGKVIDISSNLSKMKIVFIAIIVFIIIFFLSSIRIIPVGHRLVVFNNITKNIFSVGQGINFVMPGVIVTKMYDVRMQEYTMSGKIGEGKKTNWDDSLWSPTKEGLQIGIDLTCWYRLNPKKITKIHNEIGPDFEEKIIRPTIRSIVRLVISEYEVMDIYSEKRSNVQDEINKRIKIKLEKNGFIVDDVILRDVLFTADFAKSIEEKQVAQQEAKKMDFLIEKERKEAERKVIEAEGKKKSINIINEALRNNPNYIKYLYVEKLSDKISVIVSDQSTIMDLKGLIKEK